MKEIVKLISHLKTRDVIVHPFAFAVFPVFFLYVENLGKGGLGDAIGIAAGTIVFAALLWLFLTLLVQSKSRAAIIVSVFFMLFFSYGHAIPAVRHVLNRMHILDNAQFLIEGRSALYLWLVIWGALFMAAVIFTVRLVESLPAVTKFLNVVALTLMVVVAMRFVFAGLDMLLPPRIRGVVSQENEGLHVGRVSIVEFMNSWQENKPTEHALSGSSPDIYYIVLDMYARADYLEELYGYDNAAFLSFLADKGFYIASKSRTNYPHTSHALASSLNMMYLDEVAEQVGDRCRNFGPSVVMVKNSKVVQALRHYGYTVVAFPTGYGISELRDADVFVESAGWRPSGFLNALWQFTPLTAVTMFRRIKDDFHRELILHTFDHLTEATEIESPTFVFAHILAPHWPYVFGVNGEPVDSRPDDEYEYTELLEAYTNQLSFVNQRLQAAIEEILAQSSEPPIIILQADHGVFSEQYDYASRMAIFNAYYFPDQNYNALYEDITPVNTFRVIFNRTFGTDYEMLEDKSYFFEYLQSPFLFIDVTDKVLAGY